jgi:hypothetical protein
MKKRYSFFAITFLVSLAGIAQGGGLSPGICMVTVDDSSKHNIIYYDKTQFSVADSFILWRETSTPNVYARVMAQHSSALSEFMDMDTAADPNVKLHRYKLQVYDAVGGYSNLGPYHAVLYCLQNATNYNWNQYDVEGVGTGLVTEYKLLRDDNGLNQWHAIDSVPGSSMSTVDPNAMSFPNGLWRLVTKWSVSCTSTSRNDGSNETQGTIVKSKSNITNNKSAGINSAKAVGLRLFPNPASADVALRLNFPLAHTSTLRLYNVLGSEVMVITVPAGKDEIHFDVTSLAKGLYIAELSNATLKTNTRLAVE